MFKQILTLIVVLVACVQLTSLIQPEAPASRPTSPPAVEVTADLWARVKPGLLTVTDPSGADYSFSRREDQEGEPILGLWSTSVATKDHPSSVVYETSYTFDPDGSFLYIQRVHRLVKGTGYSTPLGPGPQYTTETTQKSGRWDKARGRYRLVFD